MMWGEWIEEAHRR